MELFLLRRRCASVELLTGSREAVGWQERASNVADMAPWGGKGVREGAREGGSERVRK